MEFLTVCVLMVTFFAIAWGLFYSILAIFANRELRRLGRVIRQGRFGLKSALGAMAFVAVTLGLMTALGGDITDPASLCLLTIVAPLALFLVSFFGLMFTELFDRDSTRQIVARRAREDELTTVFRKRRENEVVDAELVEPETESHLSAEENAPVTASVEAAPDTSDDHA